MRRVPLTTLLVAAALLVVLGVYMVTYQVSFHDGVVQQRLGKVVNVIKAPGLVLRYPWPIESFSQRYERRLRTLDTPDTEIKTKDGKNVIVGAYALWQVDEPLQYHISSGGNESEGQAKLVTRLRQRLQEVIGERDMSAFVSLDRAKVDASYDAIEDALLDAARADGLSQALVRELGVKLIRFEIRRISLPGSATQEVFNQMRAEREALAERYTQEGKSNAEAITTRARANANMIMAFAGSRAQELRSLGLQANTEILAEIERTSPEFYTWLQTLDALRASLANRSTIFLDAQSPLFNTFTQPGLATTPAGVAASQPAEPSR
jgi:membrane protease subunit HflC